MQNLFRVQFECDLYMLPLLYSVGEQVSFFIHCFDQITHGTFCCFPPSDRKLETINKNYTLNWPVISALDTHCTRESTRLFRKWKKWKKMTKDRGWCRQHTKIDNTNGTLNVHRHKRSRSGRLFNSGIVAERKEKTDEREKKIVDEQQAKAAEFSGGS